MPVILPFGRAIELTKPDPTMSSVNPKIGMVFVTCCAARMAGSPAAEITSTRALTKSVANFEIRCVLEAEEVESLGLPLSQFLTLLGRVAAEADQLGLRRVQR